MSEARNDDLAVPGDLVSHGISKRGTPGSPRDRMAAHSSRQQRSYGGKALAHFRALRRLRQCDEVALGDL